MEFSMVSCQLIAQTAFDLFAISELAFKLHSQLEPEFGSNSAWMAIGGGCTVLLMMITVCLHAAYKKVYRAMEDDPRDYPGYPSCLLGAVVISLTAVGGLELASRIPVWAGNTGSQFVVFEGFALGTFLTVLAVHIVNVLGLMIVMRRAWHCSGAAALIFYSLFGLVSLFMTAVVLNVLRFSKPDLMDQILLWWS
jgi:hypothetical protein